MNNHDGVNPRLKELVEMAADQTATEEAIWELETYLQSSDEARDYYRSVMNLHAHLRWLHRAEDAVHDRAASTNPATMAKPVLLERDSAPVIAAPVRRSPFPRWSTENLTRAAAILAIGTLLIGGVIVWRAGIDRGEQKADALAVAELRSVRDCVWKNTFRPMSPGAPLHSGQRLNLTQGVAKLAFKNGTSVVVEGPASFELATATSMRLDHGTVAVRANGPVKDFTIDSRDASIVDLGTSFGVHCDEKGATEVEVFEGAVTIYPQSDKPRTGTVLGLGGSARVHQDAAGASFDVTASEEDRFGNLIEVLWEDVPRFAECAAEENDGDQAIEARFQDAPTPGTVDTFYGAVPGRGWTTPWVGSGNPAGEVISDRPLSGDGDPYLHLRFPKSYDRVIAREYGARPGFDPTQPHVISWKWRFDGNVKEFLEDFRDQVYFHGNPSFRRNSAPSNTWSIGVVGANEKGGKRRKVFEKHWYVYDGQEGKDGTTFERRNMIDSGMPLKSGVVYSFAVAVYPGTGKYDVAIRDNASLFTRSGLSFRSRKQEPANVIHFGLRSKSAQDPASFSLDSVRIEPLLPGILEQRFRSDVGDLEDGHAEKNYRATSISREGSRLTQRILPPRRRFCAMPPGLATPVFQLAMGERL